MSCEQSAARSRCPGRRLVPRKLERVTLLAGWVAEGTVAREEAETPEQEVLAAARWCVTQRGEGLSGRFQDNLGGARGSDFTTALVAVAEDTEEPSAARRSSA